MIADTIISDEVWANAPDEPDRGFLFIAQAAHDRLMFLQDNEEAQGKHALPEWRRQYVYEVATVAEVLGISGLLDPDTAVASGGHMNQFDVNLARVITRIKASLRTELKSESVTLTFQTKADIREHLEILRAKINQSNLSADLQAALHKRVEAVEAELDKTRSSMIAFWKLAGAMTMAGTIIGSAADFPDALETTSKLVELVHLDKAAEEVSKLKLGYPAITAPNAALQITHQPSPPAKRKKSKE